MDHLMFLYVLVVVIAAVLSGLAVWAQRALWIKVSAVVLAGLLMATAYASLADLLGKPKPIALEWNSRAVEEAAVLAVDMQENEAIYLWLKFDGSPKPRAYVLPWNMEMAKQLNQAMRQAEEQGTGMRMRRPFDSQLNASESLFYPEPQPTLPPKPVT